MITTTEEQVIGVLKGLNEVALSPSFRDWGISVDIQNNNTIVLKAGMVVSPHSINLSKDDSNEILKLLRIIVKDMK